MSRLFVSHYSDTEFWDRADITSADIIFPLDGFPDQWLSDLLADRDIPRLMITEYSFYQHPDLEIRYVGLPLWLEHEIKMGEQIGIKLKPAITRHVFNFMIDKKRLSRYLLCKCVEIFGLDDYDYTWSGQGRDFDLSDVLEEIHSCADLNQKQKSQMLSSITIDEKFFPAADNTTNIHQNIDNWNAFLSDMFSNTAISLITEPLEHHQTAAMFTEKTLFSILGQNFPLWVGTANQATIWKEMGFDIFEDVIDHSHQRKEKTVDRVIGAFVNNMEILHDRDLADHQRKKCMSRLANNRDLMMSGAVTRYIEKILDQQQGPEKTACEYARRCYIDRPGGKIIDL